MQQYFLLKAIHLHFERWFNESENQRDNCEEEMEIIHHLGFGPIRLNFTFFLLVIIHLLGIINHDNTTTL